MNSADPMGLLVKGLTRVVSLIQRGILSEEESSRDAVIALQEAFEAAGRSRMPEPFWLRPVLQLCMDPDAYDMVDYRVTPGIDAMSVDVALPDGWHQRQVTSPLAAWLAMARLEPPDGDVLLGLATITGCLYGT